MPRVFLLTSGTILSRCQAPDTYQAEQIAGTRTTYPQHPSTRQGLQGFTLDPKNLGLDCNGIHGIYRFTDLFLRL